MTIQATDGSLKAFQIPLAPVIGRQSDANFYFEAPARESGFHLTSKQPPRPLMRRPLRRAAAAARAGNLRPSARKRRPGRRSACRLLGLRASWRYIRRGHHALPASAPDRRTGMRCQARLSELGLLMASQWPYTESPVSWGGGMITIVVAQAVRKTPMRLCVIGGSQHLSLAAQTSMPACIAHPVRRSGVITSLSFTELSASPQHVSPSLIRIAGLYTQVVSAKKG